MTQTAKKAQRAIINKLASKEMLIINTLFLVLDAYELIASVIASFL